MWLCACVRERARVEQKNRVNVLSEQIVTEYFMISKKRGTITTPFCVPVCARSVRQCEILQLPFLLCSISLMHFLLIPHYNFGWAYVINVTLSGTVTRFGMKLNEKKEYIGLGSQAADVTFTTGKVNSGDIRSGSIKSILHTQLHWWWRCCYFFFC